MQIMCLNGWGGKLYDVLQPYLAEVPPDVLCLQEVVHSPLTDKDSRWRPWTSATGQLLSGCARGAAGARGDLLPSGAGRSLGR